MRTPWGKSDYQKEFAPGIVFYGTPSHGGFKVSNKVMGLLPEIARLYSGWYNADCAWAIIFVGLRDYIKPYSPQETAERYDIAISILRDWYPDIYEALTGNKATVENSHKRAESEFYQVNAENWVVISVYAGPHREAREGEVWCVASKGGKHSTTRFVNGQWKINESQESVWIVPYTEYNYGRFGFVIDTERHLRIKDGFSSPFFED